MNEFINIFHKVFGKLMADALKALENLSAAFDTVGSNRSTSKWIDILTFICSLLKLSSSPYWKLFYFCKNHSQYWIFVDFEKLKINIIFLIQRISNFHTEIKKSTTEADEKIKAIESFADKGKMHRQYFAGLNQTTLNIVIYLPFGSNFQYSTFH